MSGGWAHSTGHDRTRTAEWKRTVARIHTRDRGICHLCGGPGADAVDHVIPVSGGGADDDANLAAVHDRHPPHCHRYKTSAEGHAAQAARGHQRRPPEAHPGLV